MPTRLQQARYDGLLRRLGDLKGPGSKVSEVLGDVFPVVDLENLPAELYTLAGWSLGFGSTQMPGVAAKFSIAQLFNPAGSGHLVVLTRMIMSTGGGSMIFEYDVDSGAAVDLFSSSIPRDTRKGVRAPLIAQVRQVHSAASLSPIGQIVMRNDITEQLEDSDGLFVLGPGTGLNLGTTVVNTNLIITFHWRERAAEPSELNF